MRGRTVAQESYAHEALLWRVQALCKSSGASLGYGFPTMDLDEELDDVPDFNGNGLEGLPEQPLTVAIP